MLSPCCSACSNPQIPAPKNVQQHVEQQSAIVPDALASSKVQRFIGQIIGSTQLIIVLACSGLDTIPK